MKIFYPFRFNACIVSLGIPSSAFPQETRIKFQEFGSQNGLTPQEAVVVMIAQVLGLHAPTTFDSILARWEAEGKVKLDRPAMDMALRGTFLTSWQPPD